VELVPEKRRSLLPEGSGSHPIRLEELQVALHLLSFKLLKSDINNLLEKNCRLTDNDYMKNKMLFVNVANSTNLSTTPDREALTVRLTSVIQNELRAGREDTSTDSTHEYVHE